MRFKIYDLRLHKYTIPLAYDTICTVMKLQYRYKHLVEKPSLCGPTCVQMMLLRRGVFIDQEQIAKELGAKILPGEQSSFSIKLELAKNPKDAGISLGEFSETKIKNFFTKHKVPLLSEVFYIRKVKDVKRFIKENLTKGNDIMANFHMRYFDKKKNWGHFNLIEAINANTITFCDPWPENKSFWKTSIKGLVASMDKKIDGKERGFVVFSGKV